MRIFLAAALAAVLSLAAGTLGLAARPHGPAPTSGVEVVVFEAEKCGYCTLFRETLAQDYLRSPSAKLAPLRFVDVLRQDTAVYPLRYEITVLPTIVVLVDGKESDRLEGYPLTELFFRMVRDRLPPAQ